MSTPDVRPPALKSTLRTLSTLVLLGAITAPGLATDVSYDRIADFQSSKRKVRKAASKAFIDSGDRSWIPGLADAMFFTSKTIRKELASTLDALSGADLGADYYAWVEWVGAHEEITPHEGYAEFKVSLLQRIDERYDRVIYPGAPTRIRLEEIVWGGVKIGGIPAVVSPAVVSAGEAELRDEELVFGATVNGVHRAYPLRVLDWHEMLDDELGGEPVALSYCTLCRSAILFHTRTPSGEAWIFGTSGLLYRSNKLMIDQQTLTLWNNLTGQPVVGRLAASDIELPVLPMTLTTWGEWQRANPDTTTIDLEPLRRQHSFDYRPGRADAARSGVSFPVWQQSDRLERTAEVYGVRDGDRAKAFPIDALLRRGVVNDRVGEVEIVLVPERESGAIRVYERHGRTFRRGPGGALVDTDGGSWTVDEEALLPSDESLVSLPRFPGHVAFWFGWYGFFPQTELWSPDEPAPAQH